jgi:hypothetical protein
MQHAGVDLLQLSERRICSWFDCRHFCLYPLCYRGTDHAKLSGGDGHRGGVKETAMMLVDFIRNLDRIHLGFSSVGCEWRISRM